MSESSTSCFDRSTLARLHALGRRLRLYLLVDGFAPVALAALLAALVTLGIDRTFRLTWDMRLAQLASILIGLAVVAWRLLWQPLRLPLSPERLAVLVERCHPELKSRLVSAVEFAHPERRHHPDGIVRSPEMMAAVVNQAEDQAQFIRFEETLNHRRARAGMGLIVGCLAAFTVLTVAAPETMGLWFQRNVLLGDVNWPQRNRLSVEGFTDGRIIVARGDDVTITAAVDPGYDAPLQVYIDYEAAGTRDREQMLALRGDVVRFTHTFERVSDTITFQVSGGDANTDEYVIEVVDRPQIAAVQLSVEPPAYTDIDEYDLRTGETVAEVLHGSEVRFAIETNKPVQSARLVRRVRRETTDLDEATPEGDRKFVISDRPEATATYYFVLTDDLGLTNVGERSARVQFTIGLLADRPPKVKMKVRQVGEMVTTEAVLPIEMDFSDTYGLASAELVHVSSREGAEPVSEPMTDLEPGTKTYARTIDWPVGPNGYSEGERVTLHARATDFDDIGGPNLGESPRTVLRVVSRDELLAELNRREQEYRQDFERILRQQDDLYLQLLTQIQDTEAEPADRTRALARLSRRQRDQASRVNTLNVQFEQILAELRINRLSTPAIEERLGVRIVAPLSDLARSLMPDAARKLDDAAADDTEERTQAAREAQEEVLATMNRVLESMVQWEGFAEAVILLRDVLKMQRDLIEETEQAVEDEIFGPGRAPGASHE